MCGNRVEELEAHVRELEASVEGLTDELVECKVRLRELENAVDADLGFGSDSATTAHSSADTSNTDAIEEETNREEVEAGAEDEGESPESESAEDSESDIIVA